MDLVLVDGSCSQLTSIMLGSFLVGFMNPSRKDAVSSTDKNSFLISAVCEGSIVSMYLSVFFSSSLLSPLMDAIVLERWATYSLLNFSSSLTKSTDTFIVMYASSNALLIIESMAEAGIDATENPVPFLTGCLVIKKKESIFMSLGYLHKETKYVCILFLCATDILVPKIRRLYNKKNILL
jgi:hypothetical protein